MMRKVFLMLFVLMSFTAFSQLQVKEGSFKRDGNAVIDDKDEHYDDNYEPMALIKISTVNINEAERMRLAFKGNRATQIKKDYLNGQVWLYISKAADFLEISHPDYSLITYKLPETLCGFCVYDMTLEYVEPKPGTGFLAISSEPSDADVYVDGKHYGKTTTVVTDLAEGSHTLRLEKQGYVTLTKTINITKGETLQLNETLQTISSQRTYLIVKADQPDARIYIDNNLKNTGEHAESVIIGSTHTYKIECNLYHTETGTVTVNERMTIEKKLRPAFGYINVSTTPEQGAKVFVNGEYLGLSPIKSDKLKSGSHTVMVMKDMFKMTEKSFTVNDGQTTNATLNMSANFINVTINTDADADIYVDDDYKAKGKWSGRLSDGLHNFEARKANHRSTKKSLDLVLGEKQTITLEAPKPINGSLDVNSSPMSAEIYIDGKHYGQTPNYINEIIIGTHELKIEKQGCTTITKTINVKEGETLTINEKLQTGKEITISTDKSGDKIYVDGNYVGTSPITSNLTYGSHNIKAERNGKEVSKTITVSQGGGENSVKLAFVQEINGHEYVDLGLSVKWATCNVGASKPEDYGNYYAWGETKTKSDYSSNNSVTYGKKFSDIGGQLQYDAARANWGGTWRLPTKAELEELENKCIWKWTTQNGVKGYKVTGPNGNSIFLPAAGYRLGSSLGSAGEYGSCWSSTPNESYSYYAYYLLFNSGYQSVNWSYRNYGLSVRPVSE